VPAAAVIPAPITKIKVVAVKKLVVGFLKYFFYFMFLLKNLSVNRRMFYHLI